MKKKILFVLVSFFCFFTFSEGVLADTAKCVYKISEYTGVTDFDKGFYNNSKIVFEYDGKNFSALYSSSFIAETNFSDLKATDLFYGINDGKVPDEVIQKALDLQKIEITFRTATRSNYINDKNQCIRKTIYLTQTTNSTPAIVEILNEKRTAVGVVSASYKLDEENSAPLVVSEAVDVCTDCVACGDIELPNKTINLISTGILVLQIAAPVILIIMGMIDFAKAVASSNEDGIKKSQKTFIRRLISGVSIFLIILIIKIVLGVIVPNDAGVITCINALFNGA